MRSQTIKELGILELLFLIIGIIVFLFAARDAFAQTWSQCSDGSVIVRCETYDCPNGDTNLDGKCSLADQGARLSDARNDSFCANPVSGCGQVQYYKSGSTSQCAVRVKETGTSCDLYAVSDPNFTPVPSSTPRPTSTPFSRLTPTPSPSPTASGSATKGGIGGGDSLPETGPSLVTTLLLGALGIFGVYLYEKFRVE